MDVEQTKLPGVVILTPARFEDHRGFFSESWNKTRMAAAGLNYDFVQDNHSLSREVGTLRGLHFQSPPNAQAKLVRCGRGRLLDVTVDIRAGSPTYAQWVSVELSFENGKQLLVPEGFLHGFVTLEPDTEIIYKCTDFYAAESDGAVLWSDPAIGVDWGLGEIKPTLSDKDKNAPTLQELGHVFDFEGATR
ncbi:MAG: dTDP-4-dehydrorhamnose 3,5-epimerase [Paracoccaceae bacterium]